MQGSLPTGDPQKMNKKNKIVYLTKCLLKEYNNKRCEYKNDDETK